MAADIEARLPGLYRTVELRGAPANLTGVLDLMEPAAADEPGLT
jgi:hypothetical protein